MDGLNWLSCANLVPRAFPQDRVKDLGKRLLGLPMAGACALYFEGWGYFWQLKNVVGIVRSLW